MQANEVIKLITGAGEPLLGQLVILDAATLRTQRIRYPHRPGPPITGLIDYEAFCGLPAREDIPGLDARALQQMQAREEKLFLLDVREPREYDIDHLPATLIPLGELAARMDSLPRDTTIVVYCQTGQRSARAVQELLDAGFSQVFNLEGGLAAWRGASLE
jgi:adenylyltransferase/sulfurtransferase